MARPTYQELLNRIKRFEEEKKACQETENHLQHSAELNRLLLESASEGIYGIDENGLTTFMNPAATKMLGYKPEELIGLSNHSLIHHSKTDGTVYPEKDCRMMSVIKDGLPQHVTDEVLWRKDQTCFPVEYRSTPIFNDGKFSGVVVTFNDISERKIAERHKEQLIGELQEALAKVKTLKGLLPICATCHKIRDDKGYWNQIDKYIQKNSEAEFSHGICPDCFEKQMEEIEKDNYPSQKK